MNLYQSFVGAAKGNAGRIAIVDGESTYTYQDLLMAVEGLAAVVSAETDKPVVGVFLPTSAAFVMSSYALFRAGYALLPFNLLAPKKDLLFAIRDSGLDTVIACEAVLPHLKGVPLKVIVMEEVVKRAAAGIDPPLEPLKSRKAAAPDDLAVLLYTSGTTGDPKGVRLTHRNILSNIEDMLALIKLKPEDRMIGIIPLFHTFALTVTMGAPMHSGGQYIAHARFNPDATLRDIERYKVSVLIAVPSMYRVLTAVQKSKQYDVSSVRLAVAGGEPLPPKVEQDFNAVFGCDLLQGYGLTETSPVVCVNHPGRNKSGTAGEVLDRVRVRTVDENGKDVGPGEIGELLVAGPNVMAGYHNLPKETRKVMMGEWLRTGDMASIDEDGYVTITGRKKEMIIVGGMNVFPANVEGVLDRHPGVMIAAVKGVEDEVRGESVKAFVVPSDPRLIGTEEAFEFTRKMTQAAVLAGEAGAQQQPESPWPDLAALEADLKQYCNEHLAQFKRPREYEFLPSMPIGPTGKVTKKLL